MATPDNINTPQVALIGAFGTLILIVVVIGLQAMFFQNEKWEEEDQSHKGMPTVYVDSVKAQKAAYDDYRKYKMDDKEYIAIPIDVAKEKVINELSKGGKSEK
jgi:hypothetical protein